MAKVTLPNGATITLPDKGGAPPDPAAAVGAAVRGAGAETIAKKKIADAMRPGDVIESAMHGATFGFSDEAQAGLASLAGDDYDAELQGARGRLEDFRERSPLAAFGSELLGGILVPGIGFNQALKATTTLGKAAGLAGAGALAGGVTGFGVGEGGFDERAGSAGTGALIGGVAAPVLVGAANIAGRGVDALLDVTGLGGAGRSATLANRKVLQALERAGLGPEDAATKMDDMRAAGTTPALMDLGQNPARTTAAAARVPGKGAEMAADFVETRQVGQADRVASVVDNIFGTNKSAAAFIDDLNATQKAAAKPLYDAADGVPLPFNQAVNIAEPGAPPRMVALSDLMGFDEFKGALKRGIRIAALEDGAPMVKWDPKTGTIPTRIIDLAKRGLDADISAAMRSDPVMARALVRFKNQLLAITDDLNPQYRDARAAWAGAMELENAVTAGQEAITKRMNPDALADLYAGLTPSQQPAFRVGVVDALKKVIGEGGDGRNKVLALFGSPNARARLEAVLGPDEFARLAKFMGIEKAMTKAQTKVAGNSITAERLADDADRARNPIDALVSAITSPRGALGNLARKTAGYTQGLNENTAANIVGMMTETDPSKLRAIIDLLTEFGAKDAARMANPLRQGMTYGVGLGGVTLPAQQGN